ncbi:hypothetical protein [Streptomyces tendae]|uniref:hypothetical protein n=1 Tax=Streptomyces tendae TaxID=1932 RepID=UPI0030B8C80D
MRRPLAVHPSTSDGLIVQLARGAVTAKPGFRSFGRDSASFTDRSRETVNAVVYANGCSRSFPFLDPAVFTAPDGRTELYLRMVPPRLPGLFFMGLAQPELLAGRRRALRAAARRPDAPRPAPVSETV